MTTPRSNGQSEGIQRSRAGSRSRHSVGGAPLISGRADNISHHSDTVVSNSQIWRCCGCSWTRNARTFMLSFTLFTTITAAQVAGALLAHSMALLADCASMALDAFTYAVNIAAECRPEADPRQRQKNQLISSGFSFFALFAITAYFLQDGIRTVLDAAWDGSGSGSDDVNPYIVFGFAVAGLLFDLACLAPYAFYGCPCVKRAADEAESLVAADAERMNLCSALMHVSADLMRSTTTFCESILIWAFGVNGDEADAYATVVVSITILLGLAKPVYDWALDLRDFCSAAAEGGAAEDYLESSPQKVLPADSPRRGVVDVVVQP